VVQLRPFQNKKALGPILNKNIWWILLREHLIFIQFQEQHHMLISGLISSQAMFISEPKDMQKRMRLDNFLDIFYLEGLFKFIQIPPTSHFALISFCDVERRHAFNL